MRTKVRFCVNLIHFFKLSAVTSRFFAYYKVESRTFHPLSSFMGSSWSLLPLFLVYSYPNERLGSASQTSLEGLGLFSATSRLGLRYAKLSSHFGYNYDIPTCFLFYYKILIPSFPLPTTLLRPSNDLATKSANTPYYQVKILVIAPNT